MILFSTESVIVSVTILIYKLQRKAYKVSILSI